MTLASVGDMGGTADKTAGTTTTHTVVTTSPSAGNAVLVLVAKDNTATSDGNTNEVTSVTDSQSNTYAKLREFTNAQTGSNAGATIAVFISRLATGLTATTDTITANHDSKTARAIVAWAFSADNNVQLAPSGATDLAEDGVINPGSMSLSSLPSKEYLFVRALARELASAVFWTSTSGYAEIPMVGTTGGGGGSNMQVMGEWDIATGTGTTSAPSGGTFTSSDLANTLLAIEEVTAGAMRASIGMMTHYF